MIQMMYAMAALPLHLGLVASELFVEDLLASTSDSDSSATGAKHKTAVQCTYCLVHTADIDKTRLSCLVLSCRRPRSSGMRHSITVLVGNIRVLIVTRDTFYGDIFTVPMLLPCADE